MWHWVRDGGAWAGGMLLAACVAANAAAEVGLKWRQVSYHDLRKPADVVGDWVVVSGEWELTAEGMHKRDTDRNGILLCRVPVAIGAVRVEFEAKAGEKAGDLSLLLGTADGSLENVAFFGFGSHDNATNKLVVRGKHVGGSRAPLIEKGKWHCITVTRKDGRLDLDVDRQPVMSVPDTPAGYAGPYLALYAWHQAVFRSVKVWHGYDSDAHGYLRADLRGYLQAEVVAREASWTARYEPLTRLNYLQSRSTDLRDKHRRQSRMTDAYRMHLRAPLMQLDGETVVAAKQKGRYIGWPTVAKTADGELLAVFSGDRDEHVCPHGKTQLVRSRDAGRHWSAPETINDGPLDDRDAGIIVLKSGTLVVNWFTSIAFTRPEHQKHYPAELVSTWKPFVDAVTPEIRDKYLGSWTRRSTDGGKTWEEAWVRVPVGSPHGPTQLADGRLLYLGRGTLDGAVIMGAAESRDEGRSWALIWSQPLTTDENRTLSEAHQAELPDGRIVGLFRYEAGHSFLWQSESADGGRSWSVPCVTLMWGYPAHVLALRDGRLLATYGYRREPFGQRVCLSHDGGRTWDIENEIVLRGDAENGDLGYPASVELHDGTIVSVYYQIDEPGEKTCLMATRWMLPSTRMKQPDRVAELNVTLGEPRTVILSPTEERRWGFYQFPWLGRTDRGDIVAQCQVADDSHDGAGERQPAPRRVSRDGGVTWGELEKEDRVVTAGRLGDGSRLTSAAWPKQLVDELGIEPVVRGAKSGHYGVAFDLYRYQDLPDTLQGVKMTLSPPTGEPETFVAAVDVPGLLVSAYRLTWTSAGNVELPGYVKGLSLGVEGTAFLELPDGTFLYALNATCMAGNGTVTTAQMYLLASEDRGRTWKVRAPIAVMPDRAPLGLYEQTLTRTGDGTLICVMRTELGGGLEVKRDLWINTSNDDGHTWNKPWVLNVFGVEPELLTLDNGVTVVSYGRPGVALRFCGDAKGVAWSDPYFVRLSGGSAGADTSCGYTKLLATGPDRFLIIYSDFFHRDDEWVLHKAIKVREVRVGR